ncbi:hypothetical protein Trydic_g4152 [Trypoxylus dichotomus]
MGGIQVHDKSATKIERNIDEKEGSEWPQIFAVFSDINIEQVSYLTVMPLLVSTLAAPIEGYLLDRFGRKITLLAAEVVQIFAWLCDKSESAENSLKKLRRLGNVSKEFAQLNADLKRQNSEKVGVARGLQQLTGISAFAAYCQYIFQEAGTSLDKGYSSMIYTFSLSIFSFPTFLYQKPREKPSKKSSK